MANLPQGGGRDEVTEGRATSGQKSVHARSPYEMFKPLSEWQEDDKSYILTIHLPDFKRQQIQVILRHTIQVCGERADGSKWRQFTEDFQVPPNGNVNSIGATYEEGVLIINVSKTQKGKPKITDDEKQQPVPEKGQDPKPQPAGSVPMKTSNDLSTKPDQDANEKQQTKSPKAQNVTGDHTRQLDPSSANTTTEATEPKGSHEPKGKTDDQRKDKNENNESTEGETSSGGATGKAEKTQKQESHGTYAKKRFKNAIKGITELDEERMLLVMGAAVLVIVTVTACVTYEFSKMKT